MARYIDVDKFTEDLRSQHCLNCVSYDGLKCKTCEIDDTIAFVESTPTADVVEVVRCKDCEHKVNYCGRIMCGRLMYRLSDGVGGLTATTSENFCSYGKRKDDKNA